MKRDVTALVEAVAALWLPFATARASAQELRRYTLDECIQTGLVRNAAILNAGRDREIARCVVRQAGSEALPQVSVEGTYVRLDEIQTMDVGGQSLEAGNLDNYSVGGKVSQILYSGGKVNAALRAARLSRDLAEWTQANKESDLIRDVRLGFAGLLLAKEVLTVRDQAVEQIESLVKQTEDKHRNGTASEFDLLAARVRLANEQPERIRARNDLDLVRESFRRLLNLDASPFDVSGELVFLPVRPDAARLLDLAKKKRPALRAQECVVSLREQDVAAARSTGLPTLRANASYNGANSYRFVAFSDDWQWHWNVGFSLTWDVWNGGLTRALVREKTLALAKSRTDLDDLRRSVDLEVRAACLDLSHAGERVAACRDNVALAEKTFQIARTRYQAGLSTRLEYTDAALALNAARLAWHQGLFAHEQALTRIEHACGVRRSDWQGE